MNILLVKRNGSVIARTRALPELKRNLLIEGWRCINHSYAMVNQFQLLELVKLADLHLFHEDLPFYGPKWNSKENASGLGSQRDKIIRAIGKRTTEKIDTTYRIAFPFRLYGGHSEKIFCFGTSEFQNTDGLIYEGSETSKSYPNNSVKIITPSNWSRTGFLYSGFDEEDVHVVPHGVDTSIYKPLKEERRKRARQALGLKDSHFTFLSVGAMSWNKGIDKLVLAFTEINRRYPDTLLILKDQRNLYDHGVREILAGVNKDHPGAITSKVLGSIRVLSKNLTLNQLSSLYSACDAYVSAYRAEGFGLTPLEAAACGTPVALTSGGATDDYSHASFALGIEGQEKSDGGNHFIEPDLESIVSTMTDLLENRASHLDPLKAVKHIHDNFSWKKATGRLTEILFSPGGQEKKGPE